MTDIIDSIRDSLWGLFHHQTDQILRLLRTPTPQKVTFSVQADANGNIGGGFASPTPIPIYQCPMSQEAYIHRLAVSASGSTPKAPLTTGQLNFVSGAGELLFFLPQGGVVAPLIMAEGYASAMHLNAGSRFSVYGDSFPAGTALRFDMQISFITGVSQFTPLNHHSEREQILE